MLEAVTHGDAEGMFRAQGRSPDIEADVLGCRVGFRKDALAGNRRGFYADV